MGGSDTAAPALAWATFSQMGQKLVGGPAAGLLQHEPRQQAATQHTRALLHSTRRTERALRTARGPPARYAGASALEPLLERGLGGRLSQKGTLSGRKGVAPCHPQSACLPLHRSIHLSVRAPSAHLHIDIALSTPSADRCSRQQAPARPHPHAAPCTPAKAWQLHPAPAQRPSCGSNGWWPAWRRCPASRLSSWAGRQMRRMPPPRAAAPQLSAPPRGPGSSASPTSSPASECAQRRKAW